MDDPIIIEFKTVGVDEVGRDMAPLVSSLDGLNKSIQDAAKAFAAMKQASSAGAGGVRQAATAAKAATGPFQQLADAQDRLNKAMTGGNSTTIKDALVNLKRRQAAAQRADNLINPKPVDPLQDMIRTARVFIGPTGNLVFNPLVNRMMGAGGPQAARAIQQLLGNAWGAAGKTAGCLRWEARYRLGLERARPLRELLRWLCLSREPQPLSSASPW